MTTPVRPQRPSEVLRALAEGKELPSLRRPSDVLREMAGEKIPLVELNRSRPDFSNVHSGSSTAASPTPPVTANAPTDFSNVLRGNSFVTVTPSQTPAFQEMSKVIEQIKPHQANSFGYSEGPESKGAALIPFGLSPERVYEKSGHRVVDSKTKDPKNKTTPTHRISELGRLMFPGETIETMERRILADTLSKNIPGKTSQVTLLVPEVKDSLNSLLKAAKREKIPLRIAETSRSQERQNALFRQGRSQPGHIVTWTLTSNHFGGRAIDLIGQTKADYDWIQANAPKYGFKVLGLGDAGHIEMPATDIRLDSLLALLPFLLRGQ